MTLKQVFMPDPCEILAPTPAGQRTPMRFRPGISTIAI